MIFNIVINIILGVIGLGAIIIGIIKKGSFFSNPMVKEEFLDVFNKWLSAFLIITGIMMIIIVGLDFVNISETLKFIPYILLFSWFVVFYFKTKKYMKTAKDFQKKD